MKAIVKRESGIFLEERNAPKLCNQGDVLLRVLIAGLCRTDLYAAQGKIPTKDNVILGHEFSAVVEAAGNAVQHVKAGDRVGVMPVFLHGRDYQMLGIERDGAFAEYIVVPSTHIYKVPDTFSDMQAAYLEPVAACLAVTKAPFSLDQHGIIYGDSRIAQLMHRIAVAKGIHNIELMPSGTSPTESYDFVIETSATEENIAHSVDMLKPGGLLVLKSRPFKPVSFPFTRIVQKEIRLIGTHYGDFQEGISLLEKGRLQVDDLFGDIYSFSEALNILTGAQAVTEDKKIFFKP